MGISVFTSEDYITFPEFGAFVQNAERYLQINACVWTPAQQSVLIAFFRSLINRLENVAPYDPNLPWGQPGPSWPANTILQDYFIRVVDAVPRAKRFVKTYPYTINPYNTTTPIPAFPTSQSIAQLFLAVAFFYGCYLSKDDAQTFLDQSDYTTYVYADAAGNVDFSAARVFITGMSRIHFCGREVTLPPNRLVILQDPAFLLTGRLVQFPQTRDDKCCQIIAVDCLQRVNCGLYITKLVRDIFCDVTCRDPCRKCNLSNCPGSCYNSGTNEDTRIESEFLPNGRDARIAGDAGQEREFRENFITIRPFVNSDLLIPQVFNRLGRFGGYPWKLALPDEFLTDREIRDRENIERENPAFDREIEPGGRERRTEWVPCSCGSGLTGYLGNGGGPGGGCSSCAGGGGGGRGNDNEYDIQDYGGKGGSEEKGGKYFTTSVTPSQEKGFRVASEVRGREYSDGARLLVEEDVAYQGGRRPPRRKCRGRCTCEVSCFEPPKLAIPVNQIRYIRPRTIFGLLEYLIEKVDWIGRRVRPGLLPPPEPF